jgi:hypothetical protein
LFMIATVAFIVLIVSVYYMCWTWTLILGTSVPMWSVSTYNMNISSFLVIYLTVITGCSGYRTCRSVRPHVTTGIAYTPFWISPVFWLWKLSNCVVVTGICLSVIIVP